MPSRATLGSAFERGRELVESSYDLFFLWEDTEVDEVVVFVPSQSSPGELYAVNLTKDHCPCEWALYNPSKTCTHQFAAEVWLALERRRKR